MSNKIVLASNNNHKLREISEILEPLGFTVISQLQAGISLEVDEIGTTFEENAALKARAIYQIYKTAVIADDSGLEVDYLNKAPGVYSSRYAGENATDKEKCEKLLSELEGVPMEKRTARFVSVICYIDKDGKEHIVRGECEGYIGFEPRGENGFGYDPIFMYGDKSFAEISAEEKNSVSHRANAMRKFVKLIGE
ncbi:MAG: XTP/dITP diphosphatase [Clostridiales bacterium]|jgi:XTP/dITP diphosphohydrolase|nr:XTP/dITP diphosphatase [Clostridiales bacterium]